MKRSLLLSAFLALAACGERSGASDGTEAVAIQPAAPPARVAALQERQSSFTKLDDKSCGPEDVIEETGDWDRRCKGAGGYDLEWSSGDLRENLNLIHAGKSVGLDIPARVAGGAFDSLGTTLEWRGPKGGAPDVLITRVHVANAEGKNDSGRLAIVRLGDSPCIVAVVPPAAGQSDRARAIADGKLPDCLAAAD